MAICVLTGDIVGSSKLSAAKLLRAQSVLSDTDQSLRTKDNAKTFDIHRGDGWQAAFTTPNLALRYALYFRASLLSDADGLSTRIGIAIGEESLNNKDIELTRSPAFIASGHALDAMPNDQFMAHASGGAWHATALLADHISRDWTQAQARAIRPFLDPHTKPTQNDVAAALGISRQAVGQALDAAGYPVLKAALASLEAQAK